MKETLHVILVLDETGSMNGIKQQTLSGLNEYINTLKKDDAVNYKMSLVTFNSDAISMVFKDRDIQSVYEFTDEHYKPRELTPLYDAIGWAITNIPTNDKVLFVVLTDGQENFSKEYTWKTITDLLAQKKQDGWQLVFLGADQDAWISGGSMGYSKGQTMSFDSQGIGETMSILATHTVSYTRSGMAQTDQFFSKTDIRNK